MYIPELISNHERGTIKHNNGWQGVALFAIRNRCLASNELAQESAYLITVDLLVA